MRYATVPALVLALGLAAPAMAQPLPNPFNDKVLQLSVVQRNGLLRQAVTKDDQKCGRLSDSVYRGRYNNLGYWTARCTPGGTYGIFIGPGGEAQVRKCADMADLKLPGCGVVADSGKHPVRRPPPR